ncbi:NAD-dependent epimerase/dehydratase family protein [Cupriavidus basilensis]
MRGTARHRQRNSRPVHLLQPAAALANPYGKSKCAAEEVLRGYSASCGASVSIMRLPNVFGKWCRPN